MCKVELDIANAKSLRGPFKSAVDAGARVVLLDLSECSLVDSTGLAAILNGARELKLAGVALAAVTSNIEIVKLFELTAIGETVPLFPTRNRALAELDGQPVSSGRLSTLILTMRFRSGLLLVSPRRFL